MKIQDFRLSRSKSDSCHGYWHVCVCVQTISLRSLGITTLISRPIYNLQLNVIWCVSWNGIWLEWDCVLCSLLPISTAFHASTLNDFVKSVFQFQATEPFLQKEYNWAHYFTFVRSLRVFKCIKSTSNLILYW